MQNKDETYCLFILIFRAFQLFYFVHLKNIGLMTDQSTRRLSIYLNFEGIYLCCCAGDCNPCHISSQCCNLRGIGFLVSHGKQSAYDGNYSSTCSCLSTSHPPRMNWWRQCERRWTYLVELPDRFAAVVFAASSPALFSVRALALTRRAEVLLDKKTVRYW